MPTSHNDNATVPSPDDQDLDWQAFLYISGEMSADEVATFEHMLSVDQSAREAVARSVIVLGQMSTVSVRRSTVTVASVHSSQRTKVFAAAVAVAALIVVCLSLTRQFEPSTDESGRSLIALWTEPRDLNLLNDEPDGDQDDDLASMDDDDADGLAIPGWLLAALQPASDDTSEDN